MEDEPGRVEGLTGGRGRRPVTVLLTERLGRRSMVGDAVAALGAAEGAGERGESEGEGEADGAAGGRKREGRSKGKQEGRLRRDSESQCLRTEP